MFRSGNDCGNENGRNGNGKGPDRPFFHAISSKKWSGPFGAILNGVTTKSHFSCSIVD